MFYIDLLTDMRSIDESFYKSARWVKCRQQYIQQHSLCERCLEAGLIVPAVYVHHRIHLTPDNVKDVSIAYGSDNLEALCFDCHEKEHGRRRKKRFRVDVDGKILPP